MISHPAALVSVIGVAAVTLAEVLVSIKDRDAAQEIARAGSARGPPSMLARVARWVCDGGATRRLVAAVTAACWPG